MTLTGSSLLYLSLVLTANVNTSAAVDKKIDAFMLKDTLGTSHSLDEWKDRRAIVVVFLGTECPIARQYAPKLAEMAERYRNKGVQFVAIDSNQQDSLAAISHYARINKITFPVLKDPGNEIADRFEAVRTPEAFVLDANCVVRYRGQIDDQFGVGFARGKAVHSYLEDAIADVLASKAVRTPTTAAVGCRIGKVNRHPAKGNVTYSNQVSRILQSRCVSCHRKGEIAPFTLTSYSDAAAWAETIRDVIQDERMPPWRANPEYGKFSNDCRLTSEEKRQILDWIENGVPEGDRSQLPQKFAYHDGWRIPGPDLIVKMPKSFTIPATGTVEYQYFVVDPGFKHDMWVRAAEGRAGNPSVVHHMVLSYMPPGQAKPQPQDALFRAVGSFGPGTPAMISPEGHARRIPGGSKLVFQMHYTPNGTQQVDQSDVGLVFTDEKTVRKELLMGAIVNFQFLIPPGEANFRLEANEQFDEDTMLYALLPHMHLRGKAFRFTAVFPDGRNEILLDVPRYDFNWQNVYWMTEPKLLPAGSKLKCNAIFDNSANNLANPNASQFVHWGDQTWDEMMVGGYYYAPAEQDLSLGPPRVTKKSDSKFDAAFRYRPRKQASAVYLAGSFNDWKPTAHKMNGPDKEGWYTTNVDLEPGQHEYKFVIDGKIWRPDPGNSLQAGEENNSVLLVGAMGAPRVGQMTNGRRDVSFRYRPAAKATAVYLAGSFNDWKPTEKQMDGPDAEGCYTVSLRLRPGRYEYKFVIDGKDWKTDPANDTVAGGPRNSVVTVGH